jgi:hypothetical protein
MGEHWKIMTKVNASPWERRNAIKSLHASLNHGRGKMRRYRRIRETLAKTWTRMYRT